MSDEPKEPIRPDSQANTSAAKIEKPVTQLTPEEQMALFEKELKESDWGHQPC